MSDSPLALARQQLQAARSQAIATVATIEAALSTLPPAPVETPKPRPTYFGADEEA